MNAIKRSLLAVVILCFIGINARWLWLFRYRQPLDIDEAGYLAISLNDYYGLVNGGILGWIRAIEAPSPHAPLTPALSSLCYLVFGPHVIVGFLVPLFAGAATIAATYFLAKHLDPSRVALISSFLVASCPVIVVYSRSYHFSIPATAVATMVLLALLRSDRFANFGWASVFGIFLGLMPLVRTMTVAFLPGIVLGAVVYAVAATADRRRRLLMLTWSLFLAAATATTWLGPNASQVFPYLLGFGYGARAAEYGTQLSVLSLEKWIHMARLFSGYVYLPHFLVMFAGAVALVFATVRRFARNGPSELMRTVVSSQVFPIVFFVAAAIAALASSRNHGTAFVAPIVPAVIVLSVWSLHRVGTSMFYVSLLTSFAVVVAIVASMPMIDLTSLMSRRRDVAVPVLGLSIVTDGRAYIQLYETAGGFGGRDAVEPIGPELGRAWVALSADTASKVERMTGVNTVVAFGFRNYLLNPNTVGLQQLLSTRRQSGFRMVAPVVTADTISGYREWLTSGDAADAGLLLLTDGHQAEILPAVNVENMLDAAKQSGFVLVERWSMPNGQGVTMWRRANRPLAGSEAPPPRQ